MKDLKDVLVSILAFCLIVTASYLGWKIGGWIWNLL